MNDATNDTQKLSENTHLRRAADYIAAKYREEGDTRVATKIACEVLGVPYSSWIRYSAGISPIPVELAKKIDALGYPKHLLRPDVWEE